MTAFVKSLRRLYKKNSIEIDQLDKMKENGKITEEEYNYITSE